MSPEQSLAATFFSGLFLVGLICGTALTVAYLPELQDRIRRWWRDVNGEIP